ncbi:hypothetical protein BH20ACI1_BH20ACI1_15440 [soil metagenome]
MVEIKEAIKIGKNFIQEVYENSDEVMLDSADSRENMWLIKFRVPISIKPINSLQNIIGINKRIFYKIVKIDEEGNVIGIADDDLPTVQSSEIQTETV